MCKNTRTPQYLRSCCSPIGQNNTKDFSAQSGSSIGRAVWKWSGKSRFPGAFSALLVNLRRFISLPDLFPLAPANRPWVSEDGSLRAAIKRDVSRPEIQARMDDRAEARRLGIPLGELRTRLLPDALQRYIGVRTAPQVV